jgi:hypothetical protein
MKKHSTKKGYTKKIAKKIKKQNTYFGLGGAQLFPTNLSYWNTFFSDEEEAQLIALKNQLEAMIPPVGRHNIANNNICLAMKEILPTYYVPDKAEIEVVNGLTKYPNERNFYYYNTILCAAFILFALLANKMENKRDCNYKLIFKGGKAIQLVLGTILSVCEPTSYGHSVLSNLHRSSDIDVLLIPKPTSIYNTEEVKTLAINISELIKWFLDSDSTTISFLTPDDKRNKNKTICKLAVMFDTIPYPFSDIDFGIIIPQFAPSFSSSSLHQYRTTIFGLDVLFECQSITNLLDEKIYYYGYYSILKDNLEKARVITQENKKLIEEYDYYLIKFKKAIISLNNGLHLSLNNSLAKEELLEENINYFLDKLLNYYPLIILDTLKNIFKDVYAVGAEKVTKLVLSKTKGQKPLVPPEPTKYPKSPTPIDYIDPTLLYDMPPQMPPLPPIMPPLPPNSPMHSMPHNSAMYNASASANSAMYNAPHMYDAPSMSIQQMQWQQQQLQQQQWQQWQLWQWQQEQERQRLHAEWELQQQMQQQIPHSKGKSRKK